MNTNEHELPLEHPSIPSSPHVPSGSEVEVSPLVSAPAAAAPLEHDSPRPTPSITTGGQNAGLWAVSADAAQVDAKADLEVSPHVNLSLFNQNNTSTTTVGQNSTIHGNVTSESSPSCRLL